MAKKKLSKIKAINFFQALTGHNKSFIQKNLEADPNYGFYFDAGIQRYHAWVIEGRIYCQFLFGGLCTDSAYFNLETFEYDDEKTYAVKREGIESIIAERIDDQ